jgi:hypothetical protein
MDKIIVTCAFNCNGGEMQCIPKIVEIVESGNMAVILYTDHIKDKILSLGYHISDISKDMPHIDEKGKSSIKSTPVVMLITKTNQWEDMKPYDGICEN